MSLIPVILWETQKTMKNLFYTIWETIGNEKNSQLDGAENADKMKDYIKKLDRIQKINYDKRGKRTAQKKDDGILKRIFSIALGVMMRGSFKSKKMIGDPDDEYRNRINDLDGSSLSDDVTPTNRAKPTAALQSALHSDVGAGFRLTTGNPLQKPPHLVVPALHLNDNMHPSQRPAKDDFSVHSPSPHSPGEGVKLPTRTELVDPSEHESVMVNPYWKADKGQFDVDSIPVDTPTAGIQLPRPSSWLRAEERDDAFRPQMGQMGSKPEKHAPKDSNLRSALQVDTMRDPRDNRRELGEGRDLLEKDECSLI